MPPSAYPFATALITGASSGIGRQLSLMLARSGVRVALVARRQSELEALALQIRQIGGGAEVLPADLARPSESFRVVEAAERGLGDVQLLIANAGMGKTGPLVNQSWEDIEQTLMVNTVGAMALVRAALPGMVRRQFGYLVGISSLASYRGFPTSAAYSASKAALSTFLESVRAETRPHKLTVIDIHPGYIRTPMTAKNKGPMPFLMDVERGAQLILRAILRKQPVYDFPWPMAWLMRLARILPPPIWDRIMQYQPAPLRGRPAQR